MEARIIAKAREVNNYKAFWCAEKVKTAKLEFELKEGRKPTIAIMGLAFKANIDDLRESPAKYIAQRIMQEMNGEEIFIVEPNVKEHPVFKLTDYEIAIEKSDILMFLVAHKEFKNKEGLKNKKVLDFCGIKNNS